MERLLNPALLEEQQHEAQDVVARGIEDGTMRPAMELRGVSHPGYASPVDVDVYYVSNPGSRRDDTGISIFRRSNGVPAQSEPRYPRAASGDQRLKRDLRHDPRWHQKLAAFGLVVCVGFYAGEQTSLPDIGRTIGHELMSQVSGNIFG